MRYDYEEVDAAAAGAMMAHLRSGELKSGLAAAGGGVTLEAVDEFEYVDPVDGSEARLQGVVLTLSGDRARSSASRARARPARRSGCTSSAEADAAKHGAVAADDLKPYAAAAIEFIEARRVHRPRRADGDASRDAGACSPPRGRRPLYRSGRLRT